MPFSPLTSFYRPISDVYVLTSVLQQRKEPQGKIDLSAATIEDDVSSKVKKSFNFGISTPKKMFPLSAGALAIVLLLIVFINSFLLILASKLF